MRGSGQSVRISSGTRYRHAILYPFLALGTLACDPPSAPYQELFGTEPTPLSADEMALIHATFAEWFPRDGDVAFADANCGDIRPEIELTDLNADGHPETFVHWGNSCTSGMAGRSVTMFLSKPDGSIVEQFGFPAAGFSQLSTRNKGYADLQFGGPGFCFGVWAWQGESYEFECNMPQEDGGCGQRENICPTQ